MAGWKSGFLRNAQNREHPRLFSLTPTWTMPVSRKVHYPPQGSLYFLHKYQRTRLIWQPRADKKKKKKHKRGRNQGTVSLKEPAHRSHLFLPWQAASQVSLASLILSGRASNANRLTDAIRFFVRGSLQNRKHGRAMT